MFEFSQLFNTFISLSRSSLNLPRFSHISTFHFVSLNGLDCDFIIGGSIVASEHFTVLPGSNFTIEHVVVDQLGHLFQSII